MDAHVTQLINFEDRITRLAQQVAEKIVLEGGMLELSQRTPERAKNATEMYFQILNGEIFLFLFSCPGLVKYSVQISLFHGCYNIVAEIDRILNDENAEYLFELLSFDREEVLLQEAYGAARAYVTHLPFVVFHSHHQAFSEAIVGYVQRIIGPIMREEWDNKEIRQSLRLIDGNSLRSLMKNFRNTDLPFLRVLDNVDRSFSKYRKESVAGRDVWLTTELRNGGLADEYDRLRPQYARAKSEVKTQKKAYLKVRKNIDKWPVEREQFLDEQFPDLTQTSEIENESPANLTYTQLAKRYGKSSSYMVKMIGEARKMKRIHASVTS